MAVVALALFIARNVSDRSARQQAFSEIADLHVGTLASASPVDVISTDRHTVKPWFQGKIPFSFNLPDLQNTEFSLLGGRLTYLDQTPGAQLIYDYRKHHISVFVFQERSLPASLGGEFPPSQTIAVQHGDVDQGWPALFRDWRRKQRRNRPLGSIVQELVDSVLPAPSKDVNASNCKRVSHGSFVARGLPISAAAPSCTLRSN